MYQRYQKICKSFMSMALVFLFLVPAGALELEINETDAFSLSADDFTSNASESGIFLTEVPSPEIAKVLYKERILHAGDALPKEALNELTLVTECFTEQDVKVQYYTIADQRASSVKELKFSIKPIQNSAPTAEDGTLETYKNIANDGQLQASDPDGDVLVYSLVKAPKRGTVEVHEDGSYSYMPEKNKVGKDFFTFCVTDEAGNESAPATICVIIRKPDEKTMYRDMMNDPDAFEAMWLRDKELFSGERIGGNLCFSPDQPVSRGEFLVMTMNMVQADAMSTDETSGFADELDTPVWMQPYVVSALNNGMVMGVESDNGIMFRPNASMTKAETAVMLQNILRLPLAETTTVFADQEEDTVPVWAADAAAALSQAGVELDLQGEADVLTRRDAANILYQVNQILESEDAPTFFWAQ